MWCCVFFFLSFFLRFTAFNRSISVQVFGLATSTTPTTTIKMTTTMSKNWKKFVKNFQQRKLAAKIALLRRARTYTIEKTTRRPQIMLFLWVFNLVRATLASFIVWCTICATDWLLLAVSSAVSFTLREISINRQHKQYLLATKTTQNTYKLNNNSSSSRRRKAIPFICYFCSAILFYLLCRSNSLWCVMVAFAFLQFNVHFRLWRNRHDEEREGERERARASECNWSWKQKVHLSAHMYSQRSGYPNGKSRRPSQSNTWCGRDNDDAAIAHNRFETYFIFTKLLCYTAMKFEEKKNSFSNWWPSSSLSLPPSSHK